MNYNISSSIYFRFSVKLSQQLLGGEKMLCGSHMGFGGHGMKFMTVEEEIEMLEGAKTRLETQLKNIDERLKKLKA